MKLLHLHKWKKIMLTSAPFAEGSYMWHCKKCELAVFTEERPSKFLKDETIRSKKRCKLAY